MLKAAPPKSQYYGKSQGPGELHFALSGNGADGRVSPMDRSDVVCPTKTHQGRELMLRASTY